MARALTPAAFLDAVEKSNLLNPAALEPYRGSSDRYSSADELAEAMKADGLLTAFQTEHLRQGKWQGFFLGTYKVLEKLGAGGSAVVYLAEHIRLKQRVAIKVLSSTKAKDREALGRFEREAKAAAAVRHPNVVHAFDFATSGRLHYMVMEFVDGPTLLKVLTEKGRMPPKRIAKLLKQAAQGLHAAHQAGIVHRDVKPSNLMLDSTGTIKVTDLGLARYEADENVLTVGKAVLGLVAYTAPEQMLANAAVDARADVYALGATFYLAATGKKPPVAGTSAPETSPRVPTEDADYRSLLSILSRMMAARPEDRYQSMAEVCTALTVSGLLNEGKVRSVPVVEPVTVALEEPTAGRAVRPASRNVELPAIAPPPPLDLLAPGLPTPTAVLRPRDAIPYAVAESDEVPLGVTPLPTSGRNLSRAALDEMPPGDTMKLNMGSFDARVLNLFEDLGDSRPLPDPHPSEPDEDEFAGFTGESEPRSVRKFATKPWVLATATFVGVLVLLLLFAR